MFQKKAVTLDTPFVIVIAVCTLVLIVVLAALVVWPEVHTFALSESRPREASSINRVQAAEVTRLNRLAVETLNLHGSTTWVRAGLYPLARVEAARLAGTAGEQVNEFGSTAWVHGPSLNPAQRVEAARLTALAIAYGKRPNQLSSFVAELIRP